MRQVARQPHRGPQLSAGAELAQRRGGRPASTLVGSRRGSGPGSRGRARGSRATLRLSLWPITSLTGIPSRQRRNCVSRSEALSSRLRPSTSPSLKPTCSIPSETWLRPTTWRQRIESGTKRDDRAARADREVRADAGQLVVLDVRAVRREGVVDRADAPRLGVVDDDQLRIGQGRARPRRSGAGSRRPCRSGGRAVGDQPLRDLRARRGRGLRDRLGGRPGPAWAARGAGGGRPRGRARRAQRPEPAAPTSHRERWWREPSVAPSGPLRDALRPRTRPRTPGAGSASRCQLIAVPRSPLPRQLVRIPARFA